MKTIYKYPITFDGSSLGHGTIEVPAGAQILPKYIQQESGVSGMPSKLYVYAMVDPHQTVKVKVDMYVSGTGWTLTDEEMKDYIYLTTWEKNGYVWHAFMKYPTTPCQMDNTIC